MMRHGDDSTTKAKQCTHGQASHRQLIDRQSLLCSTTSALFPLHPLHMNSANPS